MNAREEVGIIPDDPFDDPILFTPIANARITPQGTTYEESSIIACLKKQKKDPYSRMHLMRSQLRPNHLFDQLNILFHAKHQDEMALQTAFTCPLSKQPFQDPVVASDGNTYERIYIEAYMSAHSTLPHSKTTQTGGFYPNRMISILLDEHRCQLFPQTKNKITPLINNITAYLEIRANEPDHYFGCSKWEKFEAFANLASTLYGRTSAVRFFRDKKNIDILLQGRAEMFSTPAITYLKENSLSRKIS